ncbi:YncE family protein [Deinococcus aquiradiocola]|uniref:Zinc-finger domain-containing protein n=1 Tax=Deinococcus aquiradiocola TaxID=393059 RepID=A0A917PAK2_9DEIO|nr:hypothetical protein [Deinococcus aquiradiocola]GGJ68750.1 hypothetical protein GCM10008939_11530 [Deinococcus aquiradiocola]
MTPQPPVPPEHDRWRDELHLAAASGRRPGPALDAHLQHCSACREEWALLQTLQATLLEDAAAPPAAPPPAVRDALLRRANGRTVARPAPVQARSAVRPGARAALWPGLALGAAAVAAALLLTGTLLGPPSLAGGLPDPAVVVNAGPALLVASNGALPPAGRGTPGTARVSLVTGERVTATLDLPSPSPAWFTEGLRVGEDVYLADAGNDRVLEVQLSPLRLRRAYPVPGGVAGLSAGNGRVYYKSVRGEVGTLPTVLHAGTRMALHAEAPTRMPDVMDGVLMQRGTLYVTHHLRGELCLLDPVTLAVRTRVHVGGAPVGITADREGLLLLDVQGRLLRTDFQGRVRRTWALPGQPDKFVLNGRTVVVTDRAGTVTRLDLGSGAQRSAALHHPMDVTLDPRGDIVVAQGGRGVALLTPDLTVMPGGDVR